MHVSRTYIYIIMYVYPNRVPARCDLHTPHLENSTVAQFYHLVRPHRWPPGRQLTSSCHGQSPRLHQLMPYDQLSTPPSTSLVSTAALTTSHTASCRPPANRLVSRRPPEAPAFRVCRVSRGAVRASQWKQREGRKKKALSRHCPRSVAPTGRCPLATPHTA